MTSNTLIALAGATVFTSIFVITWVIPKVRHFLYYDTEVVEVDVDFYAYYNHEFKAVSYQGFVEEVKNVDHIFRAIDRIATKNKLVETDGFVTELGYEHHILVERREDRHYDVFIYESKNISLSIEALKEKQWLMRKTTDEQDISEILSEAYEVLTSHLYWEAMEHIGPLNIVGYCKECYHHIVADQEIPDHPGVYECECGHPQTEREMYQQ